MSNRAMLVRRHGKPMLLWLDRFEIQNIRLRDHMFASGDAWNYSRGNRQLLHKGRKP